ncbi:MAG: hypothetical protein OHK0052_13460 [Anaerolineales bacterium]
MKTLRHPLTRILLVALLNGLVYLFLVPPWQHYDEPNHFEYAWLIAHQITFPQPGDYDQTMRRAVAESMIRHNFFDGLDIFPDLNAPDNQPIWIGQYPQVGDQPLYYVLAAIPLRIATKDAPIETQLYLVRAVSLLLFLLTIAAAYGFTAELTPAAHPLRWLLPLCLALLPAFADLMTAANNDVAAIAAFSLFLWGSVRLLRLGLLRNPLTAALTLLAAILCYFSKQTAWTALLLLPILLLITLLPVRLRRWGWIAILAMSLLAGFLLLQWDSAARWLPRAAQAQPLRLEDASAPFGSHVFQVVLLPETRPNWNLELLQFIPLEVAARLSGQPLTLGAWMWSSEPITIYSPRVFIADGNQIYGQEISLTQTPTFYAFNFTPQGNTNRMWVLLNPLKKPLQAPVSIFYDGIILAPGTFSPEAAPPQFNTPFTDSGTWDGEPFTNLIRNSSAESIAPRLLPALDNAAARFLPDGGRPSFILAALLDAIAVPNYYRSVLYQMFRSFWAIFGWGHVWLWGGRPYFVLGLLSLLALGGAFYGVWCWRARLNWDSLLFLALALMLVWGFTFVRGTIYLANNWFIPGARYAYPVVLPSLLILLAGWLALAPSRWRTRAAWGIVAAFAALNAYGWLSIAVYYFG